MSPSKHVVVQLIETEREAKQPFILRFVSGLLAALLIAGCTSMPKSLEEMGPRYKPTNIFRSAPLLPPNIRRVAVLPVTTPQTTALLSAGVAGLEPILYAELEKSGRFEVIPVTGEQLRVWTGQSQWRADEPLPLNFLEKLREGTGCDAVMFSQLIRYQPYEPLAVGWKFTLVEKGEAIKDPATPPKGAPLLILWSADEVFDAGDTSVANAAKAYYSQHLRNEAPLSDSSTVLGSPSRFGQYTLNALFETLPGRTIH